MARRSLVNAKASPDVTRLASTVGNGRRQRALRARSGRAGSRVVELLLFRRAGERAGRRLAAAHDLQHQIEIPGAGLALVLGRRVAVALTGELALLHADVRRHALGAVRARQLEGLEVDEVPTGERDELELVPHRGELALELRDVTGVEVALPVE